MKVIYREDRSGKTSELIEMALKENGYIVCHSRKEALRIFNLARDDNKIIPFPITYSDFVSGSFSNKNISCFYIDNVEMFLSIIAKGVPIKAITLTKQEE